MDLGKSIVVIRGAGDLASGVAHRLWKSGFRVMMLETPSPTVVRRTVSFAEAVYEGTTVVEGVRANHASSLDEGLALLERCIIPVLIDPEAAVVRQISPMALVDATMSKRNLGTSLHMAPAVIGLGPGFTAGVDVHAVVETKRGHNLGRVILKGAAAPNTGVPGPVAGFTEERVVRAPAYGQFRSVKCIGDPVRQGEVLGYVGDTAVTSRLDGVLRGLLRDGLDVHPGMKVGDVDPRGDPSYCFTISDKARAVAGGALEALLYLTCGKGR